MVKSPVEFSTQSILMPLTPTVDRQPLHTRNLIIRGYRRADGPLVAMYNPRWHRGAETKAG